MKEVSKLNKSFMHESGTTETMIHDGFNVRYRKSQELAERPQFDAFYDDLDESVDFSLSEESSRKSNKSKISNDHSQAPLSWGE